MTTGLAQRAATGAPVGGLSTRVVLDELDGAGTVVAADATVASALATTGLVSVEPVGAALWRVRTVGTVGAVNVGPLRVQVTPKDKVGLSRLLFLLGYAKDPGFLPEDVTADAEPDLLPALAESLARQAERALSGGVLQGYVTVEDALRTVRGRIRMSDQISRRPGLFVPLEVSYDDYTADIVENRLLRSALRRMRAVPRLPASLHARLAHLDARLDGVRLVRPGTDLPTWQRTRLNGRYHAALRLSEIVLRYCSAEVGDGGVRIAAFVVSMWQVYEDFVTTALAEALAPLPGSTVAQYPDWLDERNRLGRRAIRIKPDIVHTVADRVVLVADAKYKAPSPDGRYANADTYQMLAYCTALSLPRGYLVYAGGGQRRVRRVRNTGIDIVEYPLDLATSPTDILRQIGNLAADAWNSRLQSAG